MQTESERPSTVRLLQAIDEEIENSGTEATFLQQQLRDLASRDYYHDFFGQPAFPLSALVIDAHAAGLPGIRQRAIIGEFDAEPDEDFGLGTDD